MSKVFKDFFSNLAESLLGKLPNPSNRHNLKSVFLYHSNFAIREVFHIKSTSEEKSFKIMENIEISKASGIDNSRSLMEYFLMLAQLQNSNQFSRKAKKSTHLITGLSRHCH